MLSTSFFLRLTRDGVSVKFNVEKIYKYKKKYKKKSDDIEICCLKVK